MTSFMGWVGGTIGAFALGFGLGFVCYMGWGLFSDWASKKKKRKPFDKMLPTLPDIKDDEIRKTVFLDGGKREELNLEEVKENERREFERFREYEKLRRLATITGRIPESSERTADTVADKESDRIIPERIIVQGDIDSDFK